MCRDTLGAYCAGVHYGRPRRLDGCGTTSIEPWYNKHRCIEGHSGRPLHCWGKGGPHSPPYYYGGGGGGGGGGVLALWRCCVPTAYWAALLTAQPLVVLKANLCRRLFQPPLLSPHAKRGKPQHSPLPPPPYIEGVIIRAKELSVIPSAH